MLGIEVFVVAVDKGQSMSTQGDQSADVVEDGGRVGLFLGGVDLLVVGVDGQPWMAPVVKPAWGELSHCMGVRALSRETFPSAARNSSAEILPVLTRALYAFFTAIRYNRRAS